MQSLPSTRSPPFFPFRRRGNFPGLSALLRPPGSAPSLPRRGLPFPRGLPASPLHLAPPLVLFSRVDRPGGSDRVVNRFGRMRFILFEKIVIIFKFDPFPRRPPEIAFLLMESELGVV